VNEKREHNARQELHDVAALAQIVDDLKQTVEAVTGTIKAITGTVEAVTGTVEAVTGKLDAVTGIPSIRKALTRTDPNPDPTVAEYARSIGVNRTTIYTWINTGRLAAYHDGARTRITTETTQ